MSLKDGSVFLRYQGARRRARSTSSRAVPPREVPEHYDGVDCQDERDRAGNRFFSALFMRLRPGDSLVSPPAFGPAPPAVLRVFQPDGPGEEAVEYRVVPLFLCKTAELYNPRDGSPSGAQHKAASERDENP